MKWRGITVLVALLRKDLSLIARSREQLMALFLFTVALSFLASFSFRQIGLTQEEMRTAGVVLVWLITAFLSIGALNQSLHEEITGRAMLGVFHVTPEPFLIYASKFMVNVLVIVVLELVTVILLELFLGAGLFAILPSLLVVLTLVAIGFASLGTLLAVISVTVPSRDLLLAVMFLPLLMPLYGAAVTLGVELLESGSIEFGGFWFSLLWVYDLCSLLLARLLFEELIWD